MSLNRLIYYSAVIGGWSAFLGWMVSEYLLSRSEGGSRLGVVLTCALVGSAIGTGLNLVAGMANAQWKQQIKRIGPGFLAGGLGGAIGGFVGDVLFVSFGLPRALGWMIMGAGIGVVEGLYERSPAKLRNGLIGGAVGGLAGGFLFDPIRALIATNSGMISRATAFVILGMCIGILIGLVKVVFKEAWLTVLDGYRPGRELILSDAETLLGRAEYAALPFVAPGDSEIELVHARIIRQPDGRFALEDNQTRHGTLVNNARVNGRVLLDDGAVIQFGANWIRFSERHQRAGVDAQEMEPAPAKAAERFRPPTPVAEPAVRSITEPPARPSGPAGPPPTPPVRPPIPAVGPASTSRPTGPVAAPAPRSAPMAAGTKTQTAAPVPATAPDGVHRCRSCGTPVPRGQIYFIVHDV